MEVILNVGSKMKAEALRFICNELSMVSDDQWCMEAVCGENELPPYDGWRQFEVNGTRTVVVKFNGGAVNRYRNGPRPPLHARPLYSSPPEEHSAMEP